jgi:hypothetical protein
MSEEHKITFKEVATNEGVLFTYRLVTGAAALFLSYAATEMLGTTKKLEQSISELKYNNAVSMAGFAGRLGVVEERVGALSVRINGADNRLDDIQKRVIDYYRNQKQNP